MHVLKKKSDHFFNNSFLACISVQLKIVSKSLELGNRKRWKIVSVRKSLENRKRWKIVSVRNRLEIVNLRKSLANL